MAGKTYFDKSKLWKVARRIVELNKPGAVRLLRILKLGKKDSGANDNKANRDVDMVRRVKGVMACVSSNVPLSVFANVHFKGYLKSLDPSHSPPHHLEVNPVIECLIDAGMAEFVKIVKDCRQVLGHGFASLSTDFVTDATRREAFGVILVDLVAESYEMENGQSLHMSKETAAGAKDKLLSVSGYLFAKMNLGTFVIYYKDHIALTSPFLLLLTLCSKHQPT